MSLFSKQKVFCNACGKEMFIALDCVMGSKWRVCSMACVREMNWRYTLSIMNKEYTLDPDPYKENV